MKNSSGQAALILIMIMAVVGAVSVGVASTTVENLRVQEIENVSSQAFRAADAGLEIALSTQADVPQTELPTGATYEATYASAGSDGFLADSVAEGDVVQISLSGASAGLIGVKVYWKSGSAVKGTLLSGDSVSGSYATNYYLADGDAARRVDNKFSAPDSGGTFKSVAFDSSITIPFSMGDTPPPAMIRVLVLYADSTIGIEPIGGTLASGQVVSINSTGRATGNVVTSLSFSKYSERVPPVFENVLYSNNTLSQ